MSLRIIRLASQSLLKADMGLSKPVLLGQERSQAVVSAAVVGGKLHRASITRFCFRDIALGLAYSPQKAPSVRMARTKLQKLAVKLLRLSEVASLVVLPSQRKQFRSGSHRRLQVLATDEIQLKHG